MAIEWYSLTEEILDRGRLRWLSDSYDVAPGSRGLGKFPGRQVDCVYGQYDGDEQVYVVSSSGGVPRQLTFYPAKGPLTPRWGLGQSGIWMVQRCW